MTTKTEAVTTWDNLGDALALAYRRGVTREAVADKLRHSTAELAARLRAQAWTVAPDPAWAATVFQAIDEVKRDLEAGRGQ